MDKLRFGPAGIPLSTEDKGMVAGVHKTRALGLDCEEIEFVRQVFLTEKSAPLVKEAAKKNDIQLTCHGQYFINLNSLEPIKVKQSVERILKAARMSWLAGAKSLTFHAAYYMKLEKEQVYDTVKKRFQEIMKTLKDENNNIIVRPETTGKATQWGDLKETIRLSQEVENVLPCVDFAHVHARNGKNNTTEEFKQIMTELEKGLGREILNNMHIHMSGINYTEKGERNHLILKESDMNYKDLLKVWKEFRIKGCVISESPNIEKDALLMQKTYKNL
jgi:deoxyribonuclease-4